MAGFPSVYPEEVARDSHIDSVSVIEGLTTLQLNSSHLEGVVG